MARIVLALATAALGAELHAETGQALYQSHCAGCHGLDGRGGEHAPDIATRQTVQQLADADLLRIIRNGIPAAGMPAFGPRLDGGQLSAVAAYLRGLQGERKAASLPGNAKAGRDLFFHKAGCAECHMAAGEGGFMASDLSSYAASHSIEQLRDAILNPGNSLDPHHPLATVVTKGGRQYTGVVRNEDNFSLQLETRDGVFRLFERATLASVKTEKEPLMPANYGSRISAAEMNDLVSYLMQIAATQPKQAADAPEW
jgi:cytochrome c oxidase cbb3-type subunit III